VGTPQQADYLNQKNPFQLGAGYLLADWKPTRSIHLSAGARLDTYSTFGSSVNPRLALILRPYEGGVTKLMAGKSFRAPSIYELYYNDGGVSQIPGCNPTCTLRPETLVSGELEHTHRLNDEWSAQVALYVSRLTDLIALRAVPNPNTTAGGSAFVNQYGNTDQPVQSVGGEVELRHEWRGGFMASAWYALQKSSYVQDDGVAADLRLREVPNSPIHMGGLKLVVPLVGRALRFSTRLSLESARFDTNDHPGDSPQGKTDAGATWDLVFSGEAPDWHATWTAGFYNVGDWKHRTPVSVEFSPVKSVQEQGRGLVAQLTVTY
jgi:outer membrane receptor protein involved in Fe transport